MTAGGRRDNCASGLPGAWLRGSETRYYIAPRSLPGVMMRRVQTALPAGQPPICIGALGQRVAKIADQLASFRINFVMRKPSERPAVYGSGCEGVPEAKRLAG